VVAYLENIADVTDRLLADGGFEGSQQVVVTAGGTAFFPQVADVLGGRWPHPHVRVVLRSGCYVTHDVGAYERISRSTAREDTPRLAPALEVWGRVVSKPERLLAFCDVGKRHASFDAGLPVAQRRSRLGSRTWESLTGVRVTAMNDQHGYLALSAPDDLAIGDRVRFGISHPCTTFDKWRFIPVVDDEHRVMDVVETFFGLPVLGEQWGGEPS
jgi:D-serine dehydratase